MFIQKPIISYSLNTDSYILCTMREKCYDIKEQQIDITERYIKTYNNFEKLKPLAAS